MVDIEPGRSEDGVNGRPWVSVMIPAYGDGPYLREAVRSVLAQDSPDWRLAILDDGPEDPALDSWVAGHGDLRVVYRRNPHRLGINRNFQNCLERADGELVVVMGADDRMLPDYVRVVLAAAARHHDAAWVQPAVRVIDASGAAGSTVADRVKRWISPRVVGERVLAGEELARSLLRGLWMYFPAVAFRRDAVLRHGFRPGWDLVLDLDLYLRVLLDGGRAVYLDDVVFEYRRHGGSLSSTQVGTGGRFEEERRYYATVREELTAAGWRRARRAASLHLTSRLHALMIVPGALRARDVPLARGGLRHALGPTSSMESAATGQQRPVQQQGSGSCSGPFE